MSEYDSWRAEETESLTSVARAVNLLEVARGLLSKLTNPEVADEESVRYAGANLLLLTPMNVNPNQRAGLHPLTIDKRLDLLAGQPGLRWLDAREIHLRRNTSGTGLFVQLDPVPATTFKHVLRWTENGEGCPPAPLPKLIGLTETDGEPLIEGIAVETIEEIDEITLSESSVLTRLENIVATMAFCDYID